MNTTLTPPEQVNLAWPLRECAPWCEDGDCHTYEHPADRVCRSPRHVVTLAFGEPVEQADGGWRRDWAEVFLRREPDAADPVVVIYHEHSNNALEFTPVQARRLQVVLGELLDGSD